eukprot:1902504-Karenia_brevis.AAC.1
MKEGNGEGYIKDVIHRVQGMRQLVERYLNDELRDVRPVAKSAGGGDAMDEDMQDDHCISHFNKCFDQRFEVAMQANHAEREAERDTARELLWRTKRGPLVLSGKPSTGKTTTALAKIREAAAKGAKVIVTVLTANHASRMKAKLRDLPNIKVTTVHSAFNVDGKEKEILYL